MIPLILGLAGGYLLGTASDDVEQYATGGTVPKAEKERLMKLSIEKYGEKRVEKALELLYKWTRGDVFRYKISDFEPLSLFKPKVMPTKIYKGIREEILGKRGWGGRDKDYSKSIKKAKEDIIKKYEGKLSSWSKSPTAAVKFATSNGVLIMNNPTKNEIFIDTTLIPKDYKFTGLLQNKGLLTTNIYVPENEQEVLVIMKPSILKKVYFHEVYFSHGTYLGDYKVDTMGLTKKAVTWHVSAFEQGGKIIK